jgi:glycosyltransferase involved in cell wall biosynthesis
MPSVPTENSSPTIVACVPAWNAETFIEKTLGSLAAQSYRNFRVLISVDQSTDATAEICERFAAKDERFEVLCQTRRLGWIANVNALLQRADSDYCVFAFHDDILEPSFLSELAAALKTNPTAVLAYSDMDVTWLDGSLEKVSYCAPGNFFDPGALTQSLFRRDDAWYAPHRGLFRTSIGKKIGGLRKNLVGEFSADQPWLIHLSLYGEFVRVPKVLCHKHYMKESLSLKWKYGLWNMSALGLACATEVLRAKVPLLLRLRVLSGFLVYGAKWLYLRKAKRLFYRASA